ncbi:MAG: inorganic pyrophosphatase [Candidatus Coproplasma sp.]
MNTNEIIGKRVRVTVDRKIRSVHPAHSDIIYGVNYGYIDGITGGDGEEQDAYVLGVDYPVDYFEGPVIAVIERLDDNETKWIVAPEGVDFTDADIIDKTFFQEKFFKIRILRG